MTPRLTPRRHTEILGWFMLVILVLLEFVAVIEGERGLLSSIFAVTFAGGLTWQWRRDRQWLGAELIDSWFFAALAALMIFR